MYIMHIFLLSHMAMLGIYVQFVEYVWAPKFESFDLFCGKGSNGYRFTSEQWWKELNSQRFCLTLSNEKPKLSQNCFLLVCSD